MTPTSLGSSTLRTLAPELIVCRIKGHHKDICTILQGALYYRHTILSGEGGTINTHTLEPFKDLGRILKELINLFLSSVCVRYSTTMLLFSSLPGANSLPDANSITISNIHQEPVSGQAYYPITQRLLSFLLTLVFPLTLLASAQPIIACLFNYIILMLHHLFVHDALPSRFRALKNPRCIHLGKKGVFNNIKRLFVPCPAKISQLQAGIRDLHTNYNNKMTR